MFSKLEGKNGLDEVGEENLRVLWHLCQLEGGCSSSGSFLARSTMTMGNAEVLVGAAKA